MPKKVLIALPPNLLERIDRQAEKEERTRSELMREACRRYLEAEISIEEYRTRRSATEITAETLTDSDPTIPYIAIAKNDEGAVNKYLQLASHSVPS